MKNLLLGLTMMVTLAGCGTDVVDEVETPDTDIAIEQVEEVEQDESEESVEAEDEEVTQNQKYTLILKDGRFSYGLGLGEEESTKSIYSYTSNGKMQNYKD